jgi:hypothetical protein
MVLSKWSVETAMAGAAITETSVSTPPVNNDGSGNLSDLDVQNKVDLQSLLAKKDKSFEVLEGKNVTLTFDLIRERLKTKSLEKDYITFRTTCKVSHSSVN